MANAASMQVFSKDPQTQLNVAFSSLWESVIELSLISQAFLKTDYRQQYQTHTDPIQYAGPLHMWSMFPAEGLWHWLMCNARNKNSAEATMLFAFIDKQRVDRWALTSLRTEADRYYYVGEYIAHSHKISIQVQGKMSRGDFSFLERGALIMFYVKSLPILDGLWGAAVRLFGTTHTAQQLSDVGLSRTGVTGFDFQSKPRRPWQLSVSLFWDTFSGEPTRLHLLSDVKIRAWRPGCGYTVL